MSQKGDHTWDISHDYHSCPKCGLIIENRQGYTYSFGKYIRELACTRCNHRFTVEDKRAPSFAPLFGESPTEEVEWGDPRREP